MNTILKKAYLSVSCPLIILNPISIIIPGHMHTIDFQKKGERVILPLLNSIVPFNYHKKESK